MRWFGIRGLLVLTHLAALWPLAVLVWDLTQGQLSVNPIEDLQRRTGRAALVLLVLALASTPISNLLRLRSLLRWRRLLGLYAFAYAALHFLNFVGLDYRFDWDFIQEGILEKPFALVGFAAFLSLLPLAITSTRGWMRRLGKNWERLHWLVYLAGVLAITHFVWQAKADLREPLIYSVIVAILLLLRLPALRKAFGGWRR